MTSILQLQELPLIGAVIAFVAALFWSTFNGYKEKQEGKREGRDKADREWRAREAEAERQLKGQEDETRRTTKTVDRHFEELRDRADDPDDAGELRDPFADIADHNFRD